MFLEKRLSPSSVGRPAPRKIVYWYSRPRIAPRSAGIECEVMFTGVETTPESSANSPSRRAMGKPFKCDSVAVQQTPVVAIVMMLSEVNSITAFNSLSTWQAHPPPAPPGSVTRESLLLRFAFPSDLGVTFTETDEVACDVPGVARSQHSHERSCHPFGFAPFASKSSQHTCHKQFRAREPALPRLLE